MQQFYVTPIGEVKVSQQGMFVQLDPAYLPGLTALEGFSHLTFLWWFSDFDNEEARGILQTPQPYQKAPPVMGMFATRSPIRPNPLALSTAQVIDIDSEKGLIQVAYIDANDGTPVLDIKPYTPSMDRVEAPGVPEWCAHWPNSIETSGDFDWENEFTF